MEKDLKEPICSSAIALAAVRISEGTAYKENYYNFLVNENGSGSIL